MSVQGELFGKAKKPSKAPPQVEEIVAGGFDVRKFVENFEVLAEAAGGVAALRQLILSVAVRGRLVECIETDKSLDELFIELGAKRSRLVEARKASQPVASSPVSEAPFSIPRSWRWVRLGEATICRDGQRIPVSKEVRTGRKGTYDYYGASGVIDKVDDYIFDEPLLLIGEDGANLVNRSTPIAFIASGKYWVNNHAHVLDSHSFDMLRYLAVFVNAIDLKPYVTGTAQPKMNQAKMNSIPVAVPPLAEQKRIVAKVDELMALCDDLEARQAKKRETGARLTKSALEALTTAEGPEEFEVAWKRVVENFDVVVDRSEKVAELRKAVVALALRGALVHQNALDGTAEQLRSLLTARSEVPSPPYQPALSLPTSWSWLSLSEILTAGPKNGYSPKGVDFETPVKSLTLTATTSGKFDAQFYKYIDEVIPATSELWLRDGDVLVQRGNTIDYVGVAAIYRGPDQTFIYPDLMMKMRISECLDLDFVHMALNGPVARAFVMSRATGTSGSMPKINQSTVLAIPIPTPPLKEQQRIMTKVRSMMMLCDELEARLIGAETGASKLVQAVAQEMVALGSA